jgi:hypothetical protein
MPPIQKEREREKSTQTEIRTDAKCQNGRRTKKKSKKEKGRTERQKGEKAHTATTTTPCFLQQPVAPDLIKRKSPGKTTKYPLHTNEKYDITAIFIVKIFPFQNLALMPTYPVHLH